MIPMHATAGLADEFARIVVAFHQLAVSRGTSPAAAFLCTRCLLDWLLIAIRVYCIAAFRNNSISLMLITKQCGPAMAMRIAKPVAKPSAPALSPRSKTAPRLQPATPTSSKPAPVLKVEVEEKQVVVLSLPARPPATPTPAAAPQEVRFPFPLVHPHTPHSLDRLSVRPSVRRRRLRFRQRRVLDRARLLPQMHRRPRFRDPCPRHTAIRLRRQCLGQRSTELRPLLLSRSRRQTLYRSYVLLHRCMARACVLHSGAAAK